MKSRIEVHAAACVVHCQYTWRSPMDIWKLCESVGAFRGLLERFVRAFLVSSALGPNMDALY